MSRVQIIIKTENPLRFLKGKAGNTFHIPLIFYGYIYLILGKKYFKNEELVTDYAQFIKLSILFKDISKHFENNIFLKIYDGVAF